MGLPTTYTVSQSPAAAPSDPRLRKIFMACGSEDQSLHLRGDIEIIFRIKMDVDEPSSSVCAACAHPESHQCPNGVIWIEVSAEEFRLDAS